MTRAVAVCAQGNRARTSKTRATAPVGPACLQSLSNQIHHELRTPLNAVIGFTDMMRRELLGPLGNARYREYLGYISTSAQQMLHAAEEVLSITTLMASPDARSRVSAICLASTLDDAITVARASSPGGTGRITNQVRGELDIWGDRETLPTAFAHLIRAGMYRRPHNQITIAAHSTDDAISVSLEASGTFAGKPDRDDDEPVAVPFAQIEEIAGIPSRSELSLLLAATLFHSQGATLELAEPDARDFSAEVRLERSAQQALVF